MNLNNCLQVPGLADLGYRAHAKNSLFSGKLHAAAAAILVGFGGLSGMARATVIDAPTEELLGYEYAKKKILPHSHLAHHLGFAWVSGYVDGVSVVGLGMDIEYDHKFKQFKIQGKPGKCKDYRCKDRTAIYISNIRGAQYGSAEEIPNTRDIKNEGNGHSFTVWARNEGDREQTVWIRSEVANETSYEATFSKTFGLTTGLKKSLSYKIFGIKGTVEASIEVAFEEGQETARGNKRTVTDVTQGNVVVPPYSAVPVTIAMQQVKSSYKYIVPVNLTSDVGYRGYLKKDRNAWHTKPRKRPTVRYDWSTSASAPLEKNLMNQYINRNILGAGAPWDWNWMLNRWGNSVSNTPNAQIMLNAVYEPISANMQGTFESTSSSLGDITIGKAIPIGQLTGSASSITHQQTDQVSLVSPNYGNGVRFSTGVSTPPPQPKLSVSIDPLTADDILRAQEYRAGHTKITGKHSGAAQVTLKFENGYTRHPALNPNGTWEVFLGDHDIKMMGQGKESLTVTALGNNTQPVSATRNVEIATGAFVDFAIPFGNGVLDPHEYSAGHTKITGKHSGADRVALRFESGYTRHAVPNPNGTWEVFLGDHDIKMMGLGSEKLTVKAFFPDKVTKNSVVRVTNNVRR